MAKLGDYFQLCPLIDSKSLLGITPDKENANVLVTLGGNIAIKHKVLNQKQLHSWRTKEKFTSPVLYDEQEGKYVAVFREFYIGLWNDENTQLDTIKKYKFNSSIFTLFASKGRCFITFKNGTIINLSAALKMRKKLEIQPVTQEDEEVISVMHNEIDSVACVGLLIKSTEKSYLLWTILNENIEGFEMHKIMLQRESQNLSGCALHRNQANMYLLSLWSDGKMFSNILDKSEDVTEISSELFAVVDSINCKQSVPMVSLDENYIALYGADCNDEGAYLIIYNVQFKVTQTKQPWKLFSQDAKLWCIDNKLYLPVGQSFAVIPYHLEREHIAALVGSQVQLDNNSEVIIVRKTFFCNWQNDKVNKEDAFDKGIVKHIFKNVKSISKDFRDQIINLQSQGLTNTIILKQLLNDPSKIDLQKILLILNIFEDIPDKCLVHILKLILQNPKTEFRNEVLIKLLGKRFQLSHIIPIIRSKLMIDEALDLLDIIYSLSEEDKLPEINATEWYEALFKANSQKMRFSEDERVQKAASRMNQFIESYIEVNFDKYLRPLNKLIKGEDFTKAQSADNTYSIELMHLC